MNGFIEPDITMLPFGDFNINHATVNEMTKAASFLQLKTTTHEIKCGWAHRCCSFIFFELKIISNEFGWLLLAPLGVEVNNTDILSCCPVSLTVWLLIWGSNVNRDFWCTYHNTTIVISKSFRSHVVHVYKACTL